MVVVALTRGTCTCGPHLKRDKIDTLSPSPVSRLLMSFYETLKFRLIIVIESVGEQMAFQLECIPTHTHTHTCTRTSISFTNHPLLLFSGLFDPPPSTHTRGVACSPNWIPLLNNHVLSHTLHILDVQVCSKIRGTNKLGSTFRCQQISSRRLV